MSKAFDKILERLNNVKNLMSVDYEKYNYDRGSVDAYQDAMKIVQDVAEEYNNGWIPCSERLPDVETKVLIFAIRKYKDGSVKNIITTAMLL